MGKTETRRKGDMWTTHHGYQLCFPTCPEAEKRVHHPCRAHHPCSQQW